ncbi:MAG: efflux RND transporter periplasmic adaptor subunit [Gloeomargarita sp. SKYBB_i_bin120]|nr:efflux RND transporter periplasmic adaptor subunit [Gloeomargarita sp. SKYG98]MCS7292593.1 efflux RND transporter periplasmic adaptor subunit [Gloeomargarita sp. SKYB120]MDW8178154.1 efflux RND transporter periplasmic adaptor subunit [Gloeomargarita sp. SKYBB_i_bin120]
MFKTLKPVKRVVPLVGVAALIAGGLWWWIARPRPKPKSPLKTAVVTRETLPVTVQVNGEVRPERTINISPKTAGIVKELRVQEGDRVAAGQILAVMDDSNLRGQLTQAQAQVKAAQANLQRLLAGNRRQEIAQAQAQVAEVQAALQRAEFDFLRSQTLWNQGAISRQEFDRARTERDQLQARLRQAQQQLDLLKAGFRPEEIAQARAQLLQAQGVLQVVQAQLNDTILRAPFAGVVSRIYAEPGAFVTPTTSGSTVASATSSSVLALVAPNQVVAKVPETVLPQLRLGQTAKIIADAYPDTPFTGRVTRIAVQSVLEQNVNSFEVRLAVRDPQQKLRAGMSTSVLFQVGTLRNALVVPTVAIVRRERRTGVFLATDPPQFQPIRTGISVGDKTVVKEGLQAGDRVLLSFPRGERPQTQLAPLIPGLGPPRR